MKREFVSGLWFANLACFCFVIYEILNSLLQKAIAVVSVSFNLYYWSL